MTATTTAPAAHWTVAYRKPRANRFLRVDLALTWDQARAVAAALVEAMPGFEVFYTTTAAAEASGYVTPEDRGNILVESGRRIAVREGGELPAAVADRLAEITAEATARRVAEDQMVKFAEAHGVAEWIVTNRTRAAVARQGWFLRAVEADHTDALRENEARDMVAFVADVEARLAAPAGDPNRIGREIGDAWRYERITTYTFDRLERLHSAALHRWAAETERQAEAWMYRHVTAGTPRVNAYAMIDYRAADHAEALAIEARRTPAPWSPYIDTTDLTMADWTGQA